MNKKQGAFTIEYIIAFAVSFLLLSYVTMDWYPKQFKSSMSPAINEFGKQSYEGLTNHDQLKD